MNDDGEARGGDGASIMNGEADILKLWVRTSPTDNHIIALYLNR